MPNAGSSLCASAVCDIQCDAGWFDCDNTQANGCEESTAQLETDNANCGTCGNDCSALPNVGTTNCANNLCVIDSCQAGFYDCDGLAATGCAADLQIDAANCGTCNNNCALLANAQRSRFHLFFCFLRSWVR
eukprot:TRINITY_DN606_c0_g1_i7.p2 TRINITY_DN606_c0_g1~~TRINITY_DN606_c0_g1_i7.p2  ORF type:complete len:132 (+),score=19.51 TRINITY_DN606_c0_g1_i7:343-738(+)